MYTYVVATGMSERRYIEVATPAREFLEGLSSLPSREMVLQPLPTLHSYISVPDGYSIDIIANGTLVPSAIISMVSIVVVYIQEEIQRDSYFSSGIFGGVQLPIFKGNGLLAPP